MDVDVQGRKVEVRWGFATENELKAKVYKALLEQPENAKLKRWISLHHMHQSLNKVFKRHNK